MNIRTSTQTLPIIHTAGNTDLDDDQTGPASALAGELVAHLEAGMENISSAMADWVAFAYQIENRNEASQVVRRLKYPITQLCQLYHNQMYGNREIWARDKAGKLIVSDKGEYVFLEPTPDQMKDQNTRFSARENLAYWETRLGEYTNVEGKTVRSFTDTNTGEVRTVPIDENDFVYADCTIRAHEAALWFAVTKANLDHAVSMYEMLTGDVYEYKTFERKLAPVSSGALALAASLRRK
jgi:hypothetical protein